MFTGNSLLCLNIPDGLNPNTTGGFMKIPSLVDSSALIESAMTSLCTSTDSEIDVTLSEVGKYLMTLNSPRLWGLAASLNY